MIGIGKVFQSGIMWPSVLRVIITRSRPMHNHDLRPKTAPTKLHKSPASSMSRPVKCQNIAVKKRIVIKLHNCTNNEFTAQAAA